MSHDRMQCGNCLSHFFKCVTSTPPNCEFFKRAKNGSWVVRIPRQSPPTYDRRTSPQCLCPSSLVAQLVCSRRHVRTHARCRGETRELSQTEPVDLSVTCAIESLYTEHQSAQNQLDLPISELFKVGVANYMRCIWNVTCPVL